MFQSAAVVLAPVRIGGGMRMKVLEALALGRAVVTTPRGAEGLDAPGETAFLVADSAHGIADAISLLLADPSARTSLGQRARAYAARQHGPQAYAGRLERIYEEAIALRAGRPSR